MTLWWGTELRKARSPPSTQGWGCVVPLNSSTAAVYTRRTIGCVSVLLCVSVSRLLLTRLLVVSRLCWQT